ncbi:MAG: hypothetical protein M3362_01100 [Acidobacteriota bacterium]|nr:hypothetical protein [Acidobacteriota bacterium]
MQFPDDQIEELKQLCPGVRQYEEGGVTYFFLPQLHLPDGCSPAQVDALLCPTAHHGYTSRLFVERLIASPQSRNWSTNARIMERNWHAISWQIPQTNLRLAQTLALQLRAFRR